MWPACRSSLGLGPADNDVTDGDELVKALDFENVRNAAAAQGTNDGAEDDDADDAILGKNERHVVSCDLLRSLALNYITTHVHESVDVHNAHAHDISNRNHARIQEQNDTS